MKRNFLYACLIALASVGFTACESDENGEYSDEKIPEGALLPLSSHPAISKTSLMLKTR